ncbi:MAG: peptidylprolyl isomerase, partial [Candidatus Accumulibacter sp.]|nr:peptidylprolyl isomerase [Accumulibacter sp.]
MTRPTVEGTLEYTPMYTGKSRKSRLAAGLMAIAAAVAAAPSVEMQTSLGRMVIELDAEKAPLT